MATSFYETLGVPRGASAKEIRAAYRRLARKHHPDVNPNDAGAEARFKEVQAAYDVLGDEETRKRYDKYGERWEQAERIEEMERQRARFGGGPGSGGFSFEGNLGDLDLGGIFGGIFGGAPRGPRRGQDVELPFGITLEEAAAGAARTVELQGSAPCAACGGEGAIGGARCHACAGEGRSAVPRRLEVKAPPGVRTGSRVRIAGEGRPGRGGGPPGDLYLLVAVRPHARFERHGDDLAVEVAVPWLDAVLGGEVEAPTLDGRVLLTIPPLTQNGRRFRLGGKGMPVLGRADRRGDLVARVSVRLPERLSERERELFEELRRQRAEATAARAAG